MNIQEQYFKGVPDYYPSMYLDGYTPQQIRRSAFRAGKDVIAEKPCIIGSFPIGREAACPSARQMARDEARHGKAFAGLLKRYF